MNFFNNVYHSMARGIMNALDPRDDSLFQGAGAWQEKTTSGQIITPEQAMREATAFACIRLLSDTLAMMDLDLAMIESDGDRKSMLKDTRYKLLRYVVNPRTTAYNFKKFLVVSLCLRGYFLGKKYYRSGSQEIIAIEPCHPDYTLFGIEEDGTFYWETVLCKDVARGKVSKPFTLKMKDAVYCSYGELDGVLPMSPIALGSETVGFAKEMREHGATLFKNEAMPPGVLTTDKVLRPEGRKRLKDAWYEKHAGGNRGSIAVLEQGTTFAKISMSNSDAQYLECRQYTKEEVCGLFGVPTHLISDTKRAKGWSTMEQQMMEYLVLTESPWLKRIENGFLMCLIPKVRWGKEEIKFDTKALLRGDVETRTKQQEMFLKYGVLNPNEVRHDEGMNSREGGDTYASLPTGQPETETEEGEENNNPQKQEDENEEDE